MKLAVSTYSLSRWRPNDPPRTEEVIEWISKQEAVKAVEFVSLGRPESDAVDPIKRGQQLAKVAADHGLEVAGDGTTLIMGSTSGNVWASVNAGDHWQQIAGNLAPVYCIRFAQADS